VPSPRNVTLSSRVRPKLAHHREQLSCADEGRAGDFICARRKRRYIPSRPDAPIRLSTRYPRS
jgi:hypothetical protein